MVLLRILLNNYFLKFQKMLSEKKNDQNLRVILKVFLRQLGYLSEHVRCHLHKLEMTYLTYKHIFLKTFEGEMLITSQTRTLLQIFCEFLLYSIDIL